MDDRQHTSFTFLINCITCTFNCPIFLFHIIQCDKVYISIYISLAVNLQLLLYDLTGVCWKSRLKYQLILTIFLMLGLLSIVIYELLEFIVHFNKNTCNMFIIFPCIYFFGIVVIIAIYAAELTFEAEESVPDIPITIYVKNDNDKMCTICLQDYKDRDKTKILNCTHTFHANCIDTWFKKKVNCPVCRSNLN